MYHGGNAMIKVFQLVLWTMAALLWSTSHASAMQINFWGDPSPPPKPLCIVFYPPPTTPVAIPDDVVADEDEGEGGDAECEECQEPAKIYDRQYRGRRWFSRVRRFQPR